MMTDPIADMFTRIRNAFIIGEKMVEVPHSKFKESILNVFKNEGYITSYDINNVENKSVIVVHLRYQDKKPAISHIRRLSKPGLRSYTTYHKIPRPLQGMGLVVISTPQGVISGKDAWRKKIGG